MTLLPGIRAVTFDVGGTLIDPWPSVGHVYAAVAARHGVSGLSPETLTRRFAAAWKARKDFAYTRADWADLVNETFAGLCERPPSETFFPELYRCFDQSEAWSLHGDVIPALDALARRGLPLGLVSNWDERLRPLLDRLGLLSRFGVVVISCETGCRKPSPAMFHRAAQALALEPGALLHVGDDFRADVQGARRAGWAALWLRRGAAAPRAGEIASLGELPRRLFGGRGRRAGDKVS